MEHMVVGYKGKFEHLDGELDEDEFGEGMIGMMKKLRDWNERVRFYVRIKINFNE